MTVPLEPARYHLEPAPAGPRIIIPAERHPFALVFLPIWLCGWALGEVFAIRQITGEKGPQLFLIVWLLGWTIGGAGALLTWLWMIAGREIVTIEAGHLNLRADLFGFGRSRAFLAHEVVQLKATGWTSSLFSQSQQFWPPFFGSRRGSVSFDYGARTIPFAAGLDEAEARMLIAELTPRLPRAEAQSQSTMTS